MAPVLRVFGVAIQTYPFAVLLAAGTGLWLSARAALKSGLNSNHIYDLGFYALLSTALGARMAYVVTHWDAYWSAPLSMFSLTVTALLWPGGVLPGLAVALFYGWRHRLPLGATLDALAPGMALALAIERLGAFLSGQDLGRPTGVPWGVLLWEQTRHPVQLYEMIALLAILGCLWFWRARRSFGGDRFTLVCALYAGSRLFLEPFRAQTPRLGNGVHTVQFVALGVMMGATGYLYYRRFSARPEESSPGAATTA